MRDQLRQTAAKVRRFKNVLKDPTEIDPCDAVRKDWHRTEAEIQRPYVVQAKNVIDVAVRYEDRVETSYPRTQRLLAKVDRGIDEYLLVVMLDQYGHAQAFVTRVVRQTRFTITGDRRHAGRGTRSEKS